MKNITVSQPEPQIDYDLSLIHIWQEDSGSVTIYKNDGTVWGYFGEVTVVSDGSDGSQPQIELHGAWLVGSTAEEYQMEGGE